MNTSDMPSLNDEDEDESATANVIGKPPRVTKTVLTIRSGDKVTKPVRLVIYANAEKVESVVRTALEQSFAE